MISAHEPNYAIDGIPGERYIRYHEERSRGGLGLTMTAGSAIVSRDSPAAFGNLHLYRDEVVKPLSELVERCHAQGTAVMIQLTHLGRRSRWDQGDWLPLVSASSIRERAHRAFPKAFENWDGTRIVRDYCDAAQRVRAAGFDGIELEGYGHFLDSFWSPTSNDREDEHGISNSASNPASNPASNHADDSGNSPGNSPGNNPDNNHGNNHGDLKNRLRFTKRLILALRETLGEDFLLGIRMSIDERGRALTSGSCNEASEQAVSSLPYGLQSGFDERTGLAIARELCAKDARPRLDFLNVICGRVDTDANLLHVIPSVGMRTTPHLDFVGRVRAELRVPILHAARVATIADARYAISEGKVDIVGMTRAHLADPHIARKTLAGLEDDIRPCVGASYCLDRLYLGLDAICIHNPASGREGHVPHDHELKELARRDQTRAKTRGKKNGGRRKVLIVGAGPGGLEAARVSLEKGHETIVFEASEHAGGQVRLLAQGRKRELIGIIDWRLQQIEKLKGSITYNRYAEKQDILSEGADIVVIASGGVPQKPAITYGEDLAETGWEVLGGALPKFSSSAPMQIMVYDDNAEHAGVQLTEVLARAASASSCEILYVTPERGLAPDIGGMTHAEVARVFCENDVKVEINSRLVGLERRGNRLRVELGSDYALDKRRFVEVDRLFVEHATSPNEELYFAIKDLSSNLGALDHEAFLSDEAQELCPNESGEFQLFRIGDALAARNVHAAIYDALRLCKNF